MLLTFSNGEPFATGAALYHFDSIPGSDSSARIILKVEIEGQATTAIVDTGSPYMICSPELADLIGFEAASSLFPLTMLIRGTRVRGSLYRVDLKVPATEGEGLSLEITAFVPDSDQHDFVASFPSFLGLLGCLELVRFAVDPSNNRFYFGRHP